MHLADKIKEILDQKGFSYREKPRTILKVKCPKCEKEDKTSILKANGAVICYRGSCGFKGFFEDWLALTENISIVEARNLLHGKKRYSADKITIDFNNKSKLNISEDQLKPLEWPLSGLEELPNTEGGLYLQKRGIPIEIAAKYGIYYFFLTRRVFFPIIMNNVCYGYQARAIDPVSEKERMLNNEGFRKDLCLMFYDRLTGSDHAIIAEGPVDAIKFDLCGGNVATMGKHVSKKQLDLIVESGVKKLYLALDDDAAMEMNEIAKKVEIPVYWIQVPESTKRRCALVNKKADFGEATFEECLLAFKSAKKFDQNLIVIHIPKVI